MVSNCEERELLLVLMAVLEKRGVVEKMVSTSVVKRDSTRHAYVVVKRQQVPGWCKGTACTYM